MQNNGFKKSLEVSVSNLSTHKSQMNNLSTEALYLYTNNSLDEIYYFLRNFYKENPRPQTLESKKNGLSHAESYYYSLRYELSDAYSNYLDGNLNIENFERQFNKICSHYKTSSLEIYKTYDSIVQAKERTKGNDFKSIVDQIEVEADQHWEKIEQDRQNQK